ncbi:hypothetical protein [Xylanimonas ulmi]|uniref:Vitamin K-dependent gamma-carboxylase-like protein n=1 Tax=Xylanimonas ulmi TaxID=228973 RepID=A0A4Q7M6X7_9MICO|nr:hypothetical protein [Xylanibacterium ulmi]RZS62843.1 hypothetical protein EV386_3196 [Xylanibacterium ulmi]
MSAAAWLGRERRRFDALLIAPGEARHARWVHAGVAAVVGLRLAARDWTVLADRDPALRTHTNLLGWAPDLPASALIALQVVGVLAAVAAIARLRPRVAFAVAWACYLVLCGLWTSSGKVMHNDVLTVWVGAVWLFASPPGRGVRPRERGAGWGWPPRASLAVLGCVYFLTGFQKLVHSGPRWAFSDNMTWVLLEGAHGSPFGAAFPQAIAHLPVIPQALATGALLLELTAPLWLYWRWTRAPFALAVAVMHTSIWACLGLDYSAWVLTAAAVALPTGLTPWLAALERRRRPDGVGPMASAARDRSTVR